MYASDQVGRRPTLVAMCILNSLLASLAGPLLLRLAPFQHAAATSHALLLLAMAGFSAVQAAGGVTHAYGVGVGACTNGLALGTNEGPGAINPPLPTALTCFG